jgi:hypothetical protein
MRLFALLITLVTVAAWAQSSPQPSDSEKDEQHRHRLPDSTCSLNPTNNVVPVRFGSTFVDSPLSRDIYGNLQIGANLLPNILNGGLTMVGTLTRSNFLEIHNNYAVGVDLYTHAEAGFRAPYVNFYRSKGTQIAPTPVTYSGIYEADSIGGINFGGWDGEKYFAGSAAIYTGPDEDWTPTSHAGHLSIYGTAGGNTQQIAQFGGLDATGNGGKLNIIFLRALSFQGNQYHNPALFPDSNPLGAVLHFRSGDDSRDVSLTALNVTASGFVAPGAITVANLPAAAGTAGKMFTVSDSTAIIGEGQMCVGGGSNIALAFSNGTVWKCF